MPDLQDLQVLKETIRSERFVIAWILKKQKWIKEVLETKGDLILIQFWNGTYLTLKVSGGWQKLDPIWDHESLKESKKEHESRIKRNKKQNYGEKK
jgi:hypothetical protein